MENALYYTLSTISQTLASALAVLVAFTLFRLQGIEDLIGRGEALLKGRVLPFEESWPILRDRGWPALEELLREREDQLLGDPAAPQILRGAHSAWHFRYRATRALYTALGFTVLDIALCFGALPFSPRIACSRRAAYIVLALAVGVGIICLLLYVRLIVVLVGRIRAR